MSTLSVSIVQADLAWHDRDRNLSLFADALCTLQSPTDLIVLPEMFTTGFSMDAPELAEAMNGASVQWMQSVAAEQNAAVCGSLIIGEGGSYFNRFICAMPDGALATYDKRHLFRLADEQHHYQAGNDLVTFELNGFRVCPLVCYDLRFPVWSRNTDDYDLVIYVANWPSRRHNAWQTLLRARAIENLSYCVGVNRVGTDGNDLPYAGGSAIIDFLGHDLVDLGDNEGVATAELDRDKVHAFRERFAFHKDADAFELTGANND